MKWKSNTFIHSKALMRRKKKDWHEVKPTPVSRECIEVECPHITTDNRCPYWGAWNKKADRVVVNDLWKRRGTCCFYKWRGE